MTVMALLKVTVGIGSTSFRNGDAQDALLSRAYKALYEAKANGRNFICLGKLVSVT